MVAVQKQAKEIVLKQKMQLVEDRVITPTASVPVSDVVPTAPAPSDVDNDGGNAKKRGRPATKKAE